MHDGALPTFCIVQGVMTVIVPVHGPSLKDKIAFWCQNKILVYYLYNKRVIMPWQGYSDSKFYIFRHPLYNLKIGLPLMDVLGNAGSEL